MLGGSSEREKFTAKFAQNHPSLNIWVSNGISCKQANKIFCKAGIPEQQVNLDYRAVDTVTNFTSLVEDFEKLNLKHLYLVTYDFHLPRAKAIAQQQSHFLILPNLGTASYGYALIISILGAIEKGKTLVKSSLPSRRSLTATV